MITMRSSAIKRNLSVLTEQDELVLLRGLLRATDIGVLLSDPDRQDLICNDAFCRMFSIDGIDSLRLGEEYLRREVIPRIKDGEQFVESIARAYSDPYRSFEDEMELLAPRARYIRRFTTPVIGDGGEVIGRLWTFLDITRIRRLEERVAKQAAQLREQARQLASDLRSVSGKLVRVETELTQAQRRLLESERMSAAGLLGAAVAHNIRNIVTPLSIELALARSATPEQQAESFAVMQGQLESLSLLTHKLLAIARPPESEGSEVDLCRIVEHTAGLLRPQAKQENVTMELALSPRTPTIYGDPVQFDQMIVNLVLNGIQALHGRCDGLLRLSVQPQDGGACFKVTDNGVGIPKEVRRRLFNPFFTTRPDGTGLGLYSSRRIIEEHGGKIAVRSVTGQGTRVTVWLPAGEK